MHRNSKRFSPKSFNSTKYMGIEKKSSLAPLEVLNYKKPRRWGCCRISIVLISLVFLIAFIVTTVYILLFTDLVSHLLGSANNHTSSEEHRNDSIVVTAPPTTTTLPPAIHKDLNILVLVIDTRSHTVDHNAFKQTLEAWRKIEAVWKEMLESETISDRLSVMQCQGCKAVGIKDDDRGKTIFYTVDHFRGDSHAFDMVVFVAFPTPPGEILSTLTRHGRADSLGQICQKGSWSSTGCDFEIATSGQRAQPIFRIQPLTLTETELLKFNKTIVMQKDFSTFKVLIHQPMAV